jgi:hypothetical protein
MTIINGLEDELEVKSGPDTTKTINLVAINNAKGIEGIPFDGDEDNRKQSLAKMKDSLEYKQKVLKSLEKQHEIVFGDKEPSDVTKKLENELAFAQNKLSELDLSEDEKKLAEKYKTEKDSLMKNSLSKTYIKLIEEAQKNYSNAFQEINKAGSGLIAFINRFKFIQNIKLSKDQKDFLELNTIVKRLNHYINLPEILQKCERDVDELEKKINETETSMRKKEKDRRDEVDLILLKNKIKDVLEDLKLKKITEKEAKDKIEDSIKEYETKRNPTKRQ